MSRYPVYFDNGDPLLELCGKLHRGGVPDVVHVLQHVLTEAAVKLDDSCSRGINPKGLRIVVDMVGSYVVLEHNACYDNLTHTVDLLGFQV